MLPLKLYREVNDMWLRNISDEPVVFELFGHDRVEIKPNATVEVPDELGRAVLIPTMWLNDQPRVKEVTEPAPVVTVLPKRRGAKADE